MANTISLPPRWQIAIDSVELPLQHRVLHARGIISQAERELFLGADFYSGFHDGWRLPDMKQAVERLRLALESGEAVAVFGDYDADGIPATALMVRALRAAGFTRVKGIIPTRKEGYGMREQSIHELVAEKYTVAVTVDTGITAHAAAKYAKKHGIDLIITDHHEVVDTIPDAVAVVDPKRSDSQYENAVLCGTAVGYKLLWCLYEELGISHTYLKWQLDLVAVATIADMVPLTNENRVLAKVGLSVLRKTKNYGLRALLQVAGINYTTTTARDIMFAVAPRINALSRLGEDGSDINEENPLLTLLTTEDESRALALAVSINDLNIRRQTLVGEYTARANELLKSDVKGGTVLYLPDVPSGLTGLIAGKIADQTGWPALVMAKEGDEIRGSGRSPTTASMLELLTPAAELLTRFGGHKQAAGWSMKESNLSLFTAQMQSDLQRLSQAHPQGGEVSLDTILQPHEATLDNARAITQLEPFGMGNREPLLLWHDAVASVTPMGQQKNHWRILTASSGVDMVYFNVPESLTIPRVGESLLAAVTLGINTFTTPKPQLMVKHFYVG